MKKITKSKVLRNCLKVGAAVVMAGGIGFQFHENHELMKEIKALETKQNELVQDLNISIEAGAQLENQNQELILNVEKATKEKDQLIQKNAELQEQFKKLQQNYQSLEVEKDKLSASVKQISTQSQKGSTMPSRGAEQKARKVIYAEATAYTPNCKGCTGITASGHRAAPGMIAMDRSVPLGTKVRITSKTKPEVDGYYTVADRGGDIKGNRVDILMTSYNSAVEFGRQDIVVEILN